MHFIFSFLILLYLTINASATDFKHRCLSSSSAAHLTKHWLELRSLSPADPSFSYLLNKTLTSDPTQEDETISYFTPPGGVDKTGPYAHNRQEYFISRQAGLAVSTTTVPIFTLQGIVKGGGARYSCDSITLRWVSSAKVNLIVSFSTAKLGDPVVYKGIDLLIVDMRKEKIESVYTSADYIREIKQKGFPL